ncbi:MAG: hypothetical protein SF162_06240 [bacterium]|nr:hypothetical protein [bacterium]
MNKQRFGWTRLCAAGLLMMLSAVPVSMAQDTTTTTDTTITAANEATALYVACEDRGVINLTGTALAGFDIYYQLFGAPNATGTAFSTLRQLSVDGAFAVSESFNYTGGTVPAGSTGSVRVVMAREGNSESVDFEFVANDLNDGCAEPQYGGATSTDTGLGGAAADASNVVGGRTGPGFTRSLFAPNGLTLNASLTPESLVVVGARPSETYRSDTPGLLFAECDEYPLAIPGILYDTDRVVVYWSWFTRTVEQMEQHLANAVYVVRVNTAPLNNVQRSEITQRDGSINQWVFFTAELGNLSPGHYEISYDLTWTNPVNDGYDDYGPGTALPRESGLCNFDVRLNPDGVSIAHSGAFIPTENPVHNIYPLANTAGDY